MKNHLLSLLLILSMNVAFAGEHDEFPEGALLALEGVDIITKNKCFLFVMDVGFTGPEQTQEQFFAKVLTGYSHGQQAPDPIEVKAVSGKPGVLAGTGPNGKDQIAIFLNPASLDLSNVHSFNLKWLHQTHFHTNRCLNMKVHKH